MPQFLRRYFIFKNSNSNGAIFIRGQEDQNQSVHSHKDNLFCGLQSMIVTVYLLGIVLPVNLSYIF